MHVPVERKHSVEAARRLAARANRLLHADQLRRKWQSWVDRYLLAYQGLIPVGFGVLAAGCVVGMGILTLPMHAGFPFWLHGSMIALCTGALVGGMARWLVRELRYQAEIRSIRLQAAELISHEICNALQVLIQRDYVNPADRDRYINDAIERIHVAVRDVLPSVSGIHPVDRPTSLTPAVKKKSAAAGR